MDSDLFHSWSASAVMMLSAFVFKVRTAVVILVIHATHKLADDDDNDDDVYMPPACWAA